MRHIEARQKTPASIPAGGSNISSYLTSGTWEAAIDSEQSGSTIGAPVALESVVCFAVALTAVDVAAVPILNQFSFAFFSICLYDLNRKM